ncbi:MAG: glycosyltransferase family 2 protein [Bacteroidales bacterium]|nr:glycosyltransferase family 2 protein [Bacteroidales bacterium]
MNKVGILIPVFNKLEYTKKCLKNLSDIFSTDKSIDSLYEIIIIDDASTDGTYEWISKNCKDVHILQGDGNLWWSGGINMGAKYAVKELECTHVLLWNNDIEVKQEYFKNLTGLLGEYDQNVIIGSKIYGNLEKNLVWSMGGIFNSRTGESYMIGYLKEDSEELQSPVNADWLTGMGTLVPSKVIRRIGYWDAKRYPQYIGDMEYTYRARINGFKNIAVPNLKIWNDTKNTGLLHEGHLKNLFKMLTDKRSLYNFRVNFSFYRQYATSPLAYKFLLKDYFKFFAGFFKWKLLGLFGMKKKAYFN